MVDPERVEGVGAYEVHMCPLYRKCPLSRKPAQKTVMGVITVMVATNPLI
jgi:hypothetical protein